MARRNVWVTGNRREGYKVQSEGASRAASVHGTQAPAIEAGKKLAQSNRAELLIQNQHGQIREKDSYGHDPRNRKG